MKSSTEDLVTAIAASSEPIRRLRPPLLRAAMAIALILALAGSAVMLFGHPAAVGARLGRPRFALELAASLLTGMGGVVAAFHLALPDRSRFWALLPVGTALVWLASSLGRGRSWLVEGPRGQASGEIAPRLVLTAATCLLAGGVLLWMLTRTRPLRPALTGVAGGLGAVAFGALVLQLLCPAIRR